jgi:hypothetical protein
VRAAAQNSAGRRGKSGTSGVGIDWTDMSDSNIIPFRKRPPSEQELEMYRKMTRNWHPEMRQLMFPEHFKHDRQKHEVPA